MRRQAKPLNSTSISAPSHRATLCPGASVTIASAKPTPVRGPQNFRQQR
jgi:hypothetical protein